MHPQHAAAIIRWCALLAATATTPEEAARWERLAAQASARASSHQPHQESRP